MMHAGGIKRVIYLMDSTKQKGKGAYNNVWQGQRNKRPTRRKNWVTWKRSARRTYLLSCCASGWTTPQLELFPVAYDQSGNKWSYHPCPWLSLFLYTGTRRGNFSTLGTPPRWPKSKLISWHETQFWCKLHFHTWVWFGRPVESILLATFTVLPQMSYWGFLAPMTPATTCPMLIPKQIKKVY